MGKRLQVKTLQTVTKVTLNGLLVKGIPKREARLRIPIGWKSLFPTRPSCRHKGTTSQCAAARFSGADHRSSP